MSLGEEEKVSWAVLVEMRREGEREREHILMTKKGTAPCDSATNVEDLMVS